MKFKIGRLTKMCQAAIMQARGKRCADANNVSRAAVLSTRSACNEAALSAQPRDARSPGWTARFACVLPYDPALSPRENRSDPRTSPAYRGASPALGSSARCASPLAICARLAQGLHNARANQIDCGQNNRPAYLAPPSTAAWMPFAKRPSVRPAKQIRARFFAAQLELRIARRKIFL